GLDVAADASAHIDRTGGFKAAGDFVPVDNLARQRGGDRDGGRLWRRGLASLGTAIKGGRHQNGRDRDLHRAHRRILLLGGFSYINRPALFGGGSASQRSVT